MASVSSRSVLLDLQGIEYVLVAVNFKAFKGGACALHFTVVLAAPHWIIPVYSLIYVSLTSFYRHLKVIKKCRGESWILNLNLAPVLCKLWTVSVQRFVGFFFIDIGG